MFCPDILCYAMKKEMEDVSKADKHVQLAIRKCLDLSIRVDEKMEEEKKARNKKDHQVFYEQIIVDINGFHVLRNAEVALTGELNQRHEIGDAVKKIMWVGGTAVLEPEDYQRSGLSKRIRKN